MKIIKIEPNPSLSRPPLQDWWEKELPEGYAWCPEEFEATFYAEKPAGFVHIGVNDGVVTAMTQNDEARAAYVAAHPPKPPKEAEPTAEDILDVLLGVSADA